MYFNKLLLFCSINLGPIYVTVEKTLDAFSGARELFIFVPYLIYNCVGFPLSISNSADELKESLFTVPSCYELVEQEQVHIKKEGLSLLSCNHDHDSESPASQTDCLWHDSSDNSIVPTWNDAVADGKRMARKPLIKSGPSIVHLVKDGKEDQRRISLFSPNKGRHWSNQSSSSNLNIVDDGHGKAKGYAYSPHPSSSLGNNMVRLCRSLPKRVKEKLSSNLWSKPFPLIPASGFTSVLVPQPLQNAAYVISVTSSVLSEPFAGKTRAITFQPRYGSSAKKNGHRCALHPASLVISSLFADMSSVMLAARSCAISRRELTSSSIWAKSNILIFTGQIVQGILTMFS